MPAVRKITRTLSLPVRSIAFQSARISSDAIQSCRVQQHHGVDLPRRQAFEELPEIGVHRNNQSGAVAHAFELAALQIGRQARIARAGVTSMQRLPCKIVRLVGVAVDQPQQPLMKHFVERRVSAEQRPLLRRNAKAEQQRGSSGDQASQRRMKQPMQTIQRPDAFGKIHLPVQQRRKIDPRQFRQQMGKADEAAEHAVTVKAVGEIGMPRPPDDVELVPIGARLRGPAPAAADRDRGRIGDRGGLAEKLPEFGVAGKSTKPRELELQQRQMRLVEIDRVDLGRSRREIGQRIASAGGDGDDGRSDRQTKCGEIGFRIFPYLGVDQTAEPEREKPVPNGCPRLRPCCCGLRPR